MLVLSLNMTPYVVVVVSVTSYLLSFWLAYVSIGQRPNTLLDSSKSVNTSPAATVYLCQRSSKFQDELFIQCAPWETGSYNTYHINKQWWS